MYSYVCMCQTGKWCTVDLCSAWPCVKLCGVESCAPPLPKTLRRPCPSHFRLSLLAAFPRNGSGWSTTKRFHCSHICQQQMPDSVYEQLSFTILFVINFPISNYSCGALLQCLVFLVNLSLSFLGWFFTRTEKRILCAFIILCWLQSGTVMLLLATFQSPLSALL